MNLNFSLNPTVPAQTAQTVVMRQPREGSMPGLLEQCVIALLNFLTGRQMLSIKQQQSGRKDEWVVYDSQAGTRHVFDSEQAVRTWLEQKHLH